MIEKLVDSQFYLIRESEEWEKEKERKKRKERKEGRTDGDREKKRLFCNKIVFSFLKFITHFKNIT